MSVRVSRKKISEEERKGKERREEGKRKNKKQEHRLDSLCAPRIEKAAEARDGEGLAWILRGAGTGAMVGRRGRREERPL